MNDLREKICQQIELLAEISKKENTTTFEIIECSKVMADLYRSLND